MLSNEHVYELCKLLINGGNTRIINNCSVLSKLYPKDVYILCLLLNQINAQQMTKCPSWKQHENWFALNIQRALTTEDLCSISSLYSHITISKYVQDTVSESQLFQICLAQIRLNQSFIINTRISDRLSKEHIDGLNKLLKYKIK